MKKEEKTVEVKSLFGHFQLPNLTAAAKRKAEEDTSSHPAKEKKKTTAEQLVEAQHEIGEWSQVAGVLMTEVAILQKACHNLRKPNP